MCSDRGRIGERRNQRRGYWPGPQCRHQRTHQSCHQRCWIGVYGLYRRDKRGNTSKYVRIITDRRLSEHTSCLELGGIWTYPGFLVHRGPSSLSSQRACVSLPWSSTRVVVASCQTRVRAPGLAPVGKPWDSQYSRTQRRLFARNGVRRPAHRTLK